MKKKLLFVFIVFAMIFALAGCGKHHISLELPSEIQTIIFYNFDETQIVIEDAERIDYFNYISDKSFKYENEGILGDFIIQINSDGTFSYSEGAASSYLGIGNWRIEDNVITLVDEKLTNSFEIQDGKLRWIESGSDNFTYIEVKDGEEFYENE